jgi:hypothetical protein
MDDRDHTAIASCSDMEATGGWNLQDGGQDNRYSSPQSFTIRSLHWIM